MDSIGVALNGNVDVAEMLSNRVLGVTGLLDASAVVVNC